MPNDKAPYERIFGKKKEVSKVPAPAPKINTGGYTPPDRKEADFKKWLCHDLWRIEEAIMLLLGLEPFDVNSDYWDKPQEYDDLYKLALNSQRVGTLKFHNATQVQPSIFITWAMSKEIDVPEELEGLIKVFDNPKISKPVISTNKKKWHDEKLRTLWDESIQPGVTHAKLAKKYGVTRQRIEALLNQAEDKFRVSNSTLLSPLLTPSRTIKGKRY